MRPDAAKPELRALHFGPVGDLPGGVAQVVNVYRDVGIPGWEVERHQTLSRPRDPRAPLLWSKAIVTLLLSSGHRRKRLVVVHLTQGGSFVREGSLLALANALGYGTAAFVHGSSFVAFADRQPRLVELILGRAGRIFALSDESERALAGMGYAGRTRRLVNLVADQGIVRPMRSRSKSVLFAGEVSRRKGVDVLVRAWEDLSLPDWELLIAGPVPDQSIARQALGVRYLGSISNAEVRNLQRAVSIAALPSRAETLPMFLLESMAAGCAVVGSTVGQISSLLSDGAGVLVTPGDSDSLRTALEQLTSSMSCREETAARGHARVKERYDAHRLRGEVAELWNDALGAASGEVRRGERRV